MNAQRYIINKSGEKTILFDETCLCGLHYQVCFEGSDLAWCLGCGRIYRLMEIETPKGVCNIWGVYIDPYLKHTIAGQFINKYLGGLPKGYI